MKIKSLLYLMLVAAGIKVAACDLNSAAPVAAILPGLTDGSDVRTVLLENNVQLDLTDAPGVLQMRSDDSLLVLAELSHWPTPSGSIGSIRAEPVVLDSDYDGIADAVYVIDINGRLWSVAFTASGFSLPELVADFSDTALTFRQPLRLVQTLMPNAGGRNTKHNLLLVVGSDAVAGDTLFAVRHYASRIAPITTHDLIERQDISADELRYGIDEHLWQRIQRANGWYLSLNASITLAPKVYAGVVYLTSAEVSAVRADCSLADSAEMTVHALHLHHAGAVYANRQWQIPALAQAELSLQQNPEGQLEIILENAEAQDSIISELVAISEECADCVSPLSADQFPRLLELATYQTEEGAH